MTDRELAGCAEVMVKAIKNRVEWLRRMSDHGRYMRIPSGISAGQAFELAHELSAFADDYAALLAKYEALLSRTPSSDGDGRDGERLDWMQSVFEKSHSSISFRHYARGCMGCEIFTVPSQHVRGYGVRGAIDAAIAAAAGGGK